MTDLATITVERVTGAAHLAAASPVLRHVSLAMAMRMRSMSAMAMGMRTMCAMRMRTTRSG
jgi:hypothetical protein